MSRLKAKKPEPPKTGKIKGIIFGNPKAGKTYFACSFPKPYFFDTEGGARLSHYQKRIDAAGGGYLGPKEGTLSFETLIEQVDALATEKHEYKTLVVDSITKIYQTAIQEESERLGKKDVFGASKKPVYSLMRKLVARIDRLDMNVWFVAQSTPEWGVDGSGQRQQIGVQPDVWDKLIYELDLTLHVQYHSPQLRTATVAATRLTGFPMGDRFDLLKGTEDVGYKNFSDRYGRDFLEGTVTTITLATAEQVAEIVRLLEVIKVEEKVIDATKTKYGIDEWNEMTTEQANELINKIKERVK